ncbi:putative molybdopterin-containing oxidoreductase (plasmid) [Phaeobacter inhibens]|uniref:Molybdopterin-containing oxidoreductase n=1 Tax=Phaeobacter inhibens TaxID=221822 RepID=A0ABM6RKC2_9RHOB|nr:molybdopterin-dependent oxidoreductase [Phaeobacter inhibens]AUQ52351.1 putative molybdopterin-containing oxidoreductase [Phaeobacter inhibens]AUQ96956.1 putative molybdopterin-containing oxidoreductase [Phaeobacter inhibens]AUR22156.1 putative molybdopterin-containing oxidoreductase [Phaeobacter inhibens]
MSIFETQDISGFCCLCRSRCGATFEVRDGQLLAAKPAPEHPTGKALCLKGKAAPEIWSNPDRVLYPMRRTNPKSSADPGWERVSWERALTDIAGRLKEIRTNHGAEAVGFGVTTPSGTPMSDSIDWVERFIRLFGSPNTVYGTEICNWHKDHAHRFTYGSGILFPDYGNADAILLWGFNPSAVWLDQATQIAEARARGAKIISVDPRRAGYAQGADHWMRVLPGQDGPLALGLANLLIECGAYDADFLRRWSNASFLVREDTGEFLREADLNGDAGAGRYVAANTQGEPVFYDANTKMFGEGSEGLDLCASIQMNTHFGRLSCRTAFMYFAESCAKWPVSRVSEVTSIPESEIRKAADTLMSADRIAYYCWSGVGQHRDATQTDRAIALLMALKGGYDVPGGNVAFSKHPMNVPTGFHQFPDGQIEKALGYEARPLGPPSQGWVLARDLYRAILEEQPYKVHALIGFGANMAVSHGDTDLGVDALKALDFHVQIDSVETPTARFADYLLPANMPWEREALRNGFEVSQEAESLVQFRQIAVAPKGESRSDTEIVFALAVRLGMGDAFFDGDIDAAREWQLQPSGLTLADLRAHPDGIRRPLTYRERKYAEKTDAGVRGFETPTGLVEVYSERLLNHWYDAVPVFEYPAATDDSYPLRLTTAKSGYFCHSQHRNIASLRKRMSAPQVRVHPDTAEAQGLEGGEWAELTSAHGKARMQIVLDTDLHPEVLVGSYGWWQASPTLNLPGFDPFSDLGSNYNRLISAEENDAISGSVPHRSTRCAIAPLPGQMRVRPAWSGFRTAVVQEIERVAEGCTRVAFAVDGFELLPDFLPGQHITLKAKVPGQDSPVIRCYSLIGSGVDPERKTYQITVRVVPAPPGADDLPDGAMSGYINHVLESGSLVELKAPSGRFTLPVESNCPVVMVAGGIGITPFLSYLETAAVMGAKHPIRLVYANRNSAGHAYRARIAGFKDRLPGFEAINIYNDPLPSDTVGGTHDRSGFANAQDILEGWDGMVPNVYQCGPPPMMAALESALADAGYPPERLHKEAFVSPVADKPLPNGPFQVTFAKSGKSVEWTESAGSLLDLAESHGLALASGCRAGQCESCRIRVIEGQTMHRTELAFDDEAHCLACQAVPETDVVVDG